MNLNFIQKPGIINSITILYCILLLAACKYDTEEVTPEFPEFPASFHCEENIGSFKLLPSSLNYVPYSGKDSVTFVDSLGTRLVFSIQEREINTFQSALAKYNVIATGDTVHYCYQTENKNFTIENEEAQIKLSLSIEARPDYSDPSPEHVSDVFNIWYVEPNPPPFISTQVFHATINLRSGSNSYPNIEIPQLEIFGKTFFNVERTNFSNPKLTVWYNQTEGIISFKDTNGKQWRWEGF